MTGFSADQRRQILESFERGKPLVCPACAGEITLSDAAPRPDVAYVRSRVWARCTGCRRVTMLEARDRPG